MWQLRERGATLQAIADEFGIGAARVSFVFKKYGFPTERVGRRARALPRVRTMHRLYEQGLSLAQVGERYGVSESRVSQLFRWAGLATRSGRAAAADWTSPAVTDT